MQDTIYSRPKVELSFDKKTVILYENCYKIGKETISSKSTDPLRVKLINYSDGVMYND